MLENLNAVCGMILVLHLRLIYWWRTNLYSTITYLLPKLVLQSSITGPGLITWLELPESSINPFRQGISLFLRSHLRHTLPTTNFQNRRPSYCIHIYLKCTLRIFSFSQLHPPRYFTSLIKQTKTKIFNQILVTAPMSKKSL